MYKLPRKYLSYSAISLWYKNKREFRRRYYEGVRPPDTKFTLFGKEIEEYIYRGDYPDIPYWGGKQHKLQHTVEGVPVVGYLDTFDKETKTFADYKSALPKPDGSPRWTQKDVDNLKQLPFYSFLIERIYGEVNDTCYLVSLETELKKPDTLLSNGESVALTGNFETFERTIDKEERDGILEYITTAADEIHRDYELWQAGIQNPPEYIDEKVY